MKKETTSHFSSTFLGKCPIIAEDSVIRPNTLLDQWNNNFLWGLSDLKHFFKKSPTLLKNQGLLVPVKSCIHLSDILIFK